MTAIKKTIVILVSLMLFAASVSGCARTGEPQKITVIEDRSYFEDFEISGNNVRIYCHYVVKNNTSEQLKFKIKGNFKADVKGGLLKEATLYAASMDFGVHGSAEFEFTIGPGGERELEVVFIGEAGGSEAKHDRLLPKTEIEYIYESE